MKKINYFLLVLCFSVVFVACSSVDLLIDNAEEACQEGDAEELVEVMEKIADRRDDGKLTEEQSERIDKLVLEYPDVFSGAVAIKLGEKNK